MQNFQENTVQTTEYVQQGEVRYEYQEEHIVGDQHYTTQKQYVQQLGGPPVVTSSSHQFTQNVGYQQQQQQQAQLSGQIVVTFHSASDLVRVQTVGKQDPFIQFSTDYSDAKSFQKTFTHKSGGKSATWNQSFTIPYGRELYVEVLDEESVSMSELIGFAAITLQYATNSIYTIYTVDGKPAGEIHLSVAQQGQQAPSGNPTRGQSYVNDGHLQRCKSMRKKAVAADVGLVAAGGLLAAGAGLLGKKLYDDHKEKEKQEEEEKAEHERLEEENKRLQEEKAAFQEQESHKQKQECEPHEKKKQECEPHKKDSHSKKEKKHGHCEPKESSSSSSSSSERSSSGRGKEWDPVGTYAAGDRVKYHGKTYVCLQGHSSNPTWMPSVAHSLWQKA